MSYIKNFMFYITDGSLDTDEFISYVKRTAKSLSIIIYNIQYVSSNHSYKISLITNSEEYALRFISKVETEYREVNVGYSQ